MRDLIINLLNKLNALKLDNKKIFIIIPACLLIFYIDCMFIIKSQLRGIKTLTPKIIELKKDIDNLTKDLSWIQDLERKASKDKTQIGALKPKEIISEDKLLLLLQEVSDLADKNKVKIMQISTSKDKKIQEEVIAGERLLPIIITLDLTCGYHSLGSFINALENARLFIDLQDMKIVPDPHNYLLQKVNLALKTYAKK
ncbi:MAG: type 4a pilus biogenesis protein PilO [Candidatus Omnitrophota bacterium]|nr:type 4a pilus biogenesis protein PilO [Candidatus Omnitrophota bacterium]